MPDNRTVYLADDGYNVGWYKFVADMPGNLSSGSLYAAKMNQLDDLNGGTFDVSWIELGSANQSALLEMLDDPKMTFDSIFKSAKPRSDASCPSGFTAVNTQANRGKVECLQLIPGQAMAAAFFETRRWAAMLGATTEFSKWEGQTYDPEHNVLFISISDVFYGMEDGATLGKKSSRYDAGTPNDVHLKYNPCGCVYTILLDETFNAVRMEALLCGVPRDPLVATVDDPANICELDGKRFRGSTRICVFVLFFCFVLFFFCFPFFCSRKCFNSSSTRRTLDMRW